ncbi:MAG: UvrD-helicase domain-containing protein [Candidatus Aegiribacteria sp.]|nr:UvrD-helicase domain-containing protein [Candidatus Aegiribacteria sp.]
MKKGTAPGDQQSRDAIIRETDRNVFVQASAGTGKTTLMVDRVVELVKNGIPLERIAVVTFTRPAAAELRMRVRNRISEEKDNGNCLEAGKVVSVAWISTIHRFASRILREYFNLTGVDPAFTTTEGHFDPLEINREWDRWLLGLQGQPHREILEMTGTGLQREITLGIEKRRWLDSVDNVGGSTTAELSVLDEFISTHGAAVEVVLDECNNSSDTVFKKVKHFLGELVELRLRLPEISHEELMRLHLSLNLQGGSKNNWEDFKYAKDIFKAAGKQFKKILPVLKSGDLTELTWDFAGGFAGELRRKWDRDRSRLSYDDLLYVTWKAIAGNDMLSRCLFDRFDHVLIDEFQDTSSDQVRLFAAFLEQAGSLPQGCVTIVADDKQSIYGWRNADIETYRSFRKRLEEGGALSETITTNFRSSEAVIRFVNAFGSHLFRDQTPEELPFGCSYSPIEPRPGAPLGEPVRVVKLPDMPAEYRDRYSVNSYGTHLQAQWYVDYLKRGFRDGNSPGDYALLFRSGTHIHHFIDAFEREGIPYYVNSSRDFFNRPEITDLREIVRCILYPGDSMAWVHTLRSLFFGISDKVINRAIAAGTKGYSERDDECPREVREVNSQLRRLRQSILTVPLEDFLFELFFQTEMIPVVAAAGYQESRRMGNLQFLLERVLSGDIKTPADLLTVLDENLAPARQEEPSTVPAEGGAVTVTTIHRAKGLAWNNVALAAPSVVSSKGVRDRVISYDHERKAAFNLGIPLPGDGGSTIRSPFWPEIVEIVRAREKAEFRRLIYVAVTRPRDSLVVFVKPPSKPNSSPGQILWENIMSAAESDPGCLSIEEVLPTDISYHSSARRPEIEMTDNFEGNDDNPLFEIDPKPENWQSGGAVIGECVHAVMEKIDFNAPEQWFTDNENFLRRIYGYNFEEIRELSLNFFRMKLPFDLEKSEILGREYAYIVKTSGRIKKRYIDLLLRDNGRLAVVDYKTDSFGGSSATQAAQGYIEKQRYYLRDISEIFGVQAFGYLVFLREETVYPVMPD